MLLFAQTEDMRIYNRNGSLKKVSFQGFIDYWYTPTIYSWLVLSGIWLYNLLSVDNQEQINVVCIIGSR
jgi:hypothetical protein